MFQTLIDYLKTKLSPKKQYVLHHSPAEDWFELTREELAHHILMLGYDVGSKTTPRREIHTREQLEIIVAYNAVLDLNSTNREPYIKEKHAELTYDDAYETCTKKWLERGVDAIQSSLDKEGIPYVDGQEIQLHLITSRELKQLANAYNIVVRIEEDLLHSTLRTIDLTRKELGIDSDEPIMPYEENHL